MSLGRSPHQGKAERGNARLTATIQVLGHLKHGLHYVVLARRLSGQCCVCPSFWMQKGSLHQLAVHQPCTRYLQRSRPKSLLMPSTRWWQHPGVLPVGRETVRPAAASPTAAQTPRDVCVRWVLTWYVLHIVAGQNWHTQVGGEWHTQSAVRKRTMNKSTVKFEAVVDGQSEVDTKWSS